MSLLSNSYHARLKVSSVLMALVIAVSATGMLPVSTVRAARDPAPAADGGSIIVDNYSDDEGATACTSDPNDCSLRGAINKANSRSGGDVIYLPSGQFNLYGSAGDDANKGGDLDVKESGGYLTIIGEGMDKTTINGNYNDRIIDEVEDGSPIHITLKNLTLTRGGFSAYPADGGAIRLRGSLILDMVNINNSIGTNGGAIYIKSEYSDTLTINRSVFSYNTSTLDGGAIYNVAELATITNSTFDHNKATGVGGLPFGNLNSGRGGAIFNNSNLNVTSSTFAYNDGKNESGAVINYAFQGEHSNAYIKNSSFHLNSTAIMNYTNGNEVSTTSAVTTITNSILSNSTHTENCVNKVEEKGNATIINGGNNLDTGVSCGFGSNSGSVSGQDAHLAGLEDNGGPTPTLALQSGSPAIDSASTSACPHRDQRGLSDVGTCDMGAYEYGAAPVMAPSLGVQHSSLSDGTSGSQLQVSLTNQIGNPLEGWGVSYEVPDGSGIPVSDTYAVSNTSGLAWIFAGYSGLTGSYTITARTSGAYAWFLINQYGIIPKGTWTTGLTYTGFAPN